jgi:trehalose 6-phosphate synthase/phosphatase
LIFDVTSPGRRNPPLFISNITLQLLFHLDINLETKNTHLSPTIMRVISVTFTIPYTLSLLPDLGISRRRENSALCDSFSYLNASKVSHTLIGWTGEIEQSVRLTPEDKVRFQTLLRSTEQGKIVPVWLPNDGKNQGRWRTYGELAIHGLFHYKQSEAANGPAIKKAWADYGQMNKLFADQILETYHPGDIIIIHDYNLMLLPALLRLRLPRAYIGFFLHIPFPSSELFRCIGQRNELLEGLLGATMVGLQSSGYIRHFASCCTDILGIDASAAGVDGYGVPVAVEAFPVGIDAAATEETAFHDLAVTEKKVDIRQLFTGKKIIISCDSLDNFRGVTQKLQAFEFFLSRYPEWHDQVVLIQISCAREVNRKGYDSESKFLDKISELAGKIISMHGSLGFTPVHHISQYLAKEEYYSLLQVADVALFTSVRDGMNTVSFEYIICQKDNHSPLILSEFSDTSANLAGAIRVNPWDPGAVADAINDALCMSAETREAQNKLLYHHVVTNNIQLWIDTIVKRLLVHVDVHKHCFYTPPLDYEKLLHQYKQPGKRLLMFDYDGTLTPIVQDPAAAIPTDRLYTILQTLASDPKNTVWIISGRDQVFLDQCLGHVFNLGLSAEHGCFMRHPQKMEWENISEHTDMGWQQDVVDIFQRYTEKTPGPLLFSYFPFTEVLFSFQVTQIFPQC